MKFLLFILVLVMFCLQCKTIQTESPISGDSALHNPSGKMRLYVISMGYGGLKHSRYCAILEEDGKRHLLTTRGAIQEKQLRQAVRYTSKVRLFFGWFAHSEAIKEGEKDELVFQMRFSDAIFLSGEEGVRIKRVSALQDTSGEEDIELTTRKLKIIADRIRQTQPHKGRSEVCQKELKEKFPDLSY